MLKIVLHVTFYFQTLAHSPDSDGCHKFWKLLYKPQNQQFFKQLRFSDSGYDTVHILVSQCVEVKEREHYGILYSPTKFQANLQKILLQ
jgi:hypothetical protein